MLKRGSCGSLGGKVRQPQDLFVVGEVADRLGAELGELAQVEKEPPRSVGRRRRFPRLMDRDRNPPFLEKDRLSG